MALAPEVVFGAALAAAAGSVDAAGLAKWIQIAKAINDQIKSATVTGTATAVQGGAGTAPVTGTLS